MNSLLLKIIFVATSLVNFIVIDIAVAATDTNPQLLLKSYAAQAKKENPSFKEFTVLRGEQFYHAERVHSEGDKVSCMTCHTTNPKNIGKTRAHKEIQPMAVSLNTERFSDTEKVEKWFKRNCQDVLERACSAQEKGDFIAYLLSVK